MMQSDTQTDELEAKALPATTERHKSKGAKIRSLFIIYAMITFSSLLRAINMEIFILPNEFAPGGVTGISAMLQFKTGLSSGIFLLTLNLPLIVVSGFLLSRKFAIRTAVAAVITSGTLFLFNSLNFSPNDFALVQTQNTTLSAIAGGAVSGAALAIILKCGASSGGTDIIATVFHKHRPDKDIGWVIFIMDASVVFVSLFVYKRGLDPVLLAFILIFVSSAVCNTILSGFKSAQKYEIITKEPEAVSAEIMKKLARGVTMLPAKGMYKHEERYLLVCIVRKRQVPEMQKIIKKFPDTFCFVSNTSDVYGLGFSSGG